ncbi:MAG: HEAT repeat domain-containing protein [bacterium]
MDKDWKDIKEGDNVWLSVVCIDMVGSTNLYHEVGNEETERRKNFFRRTAERVLGERRCEWHGEGTTFFFDNNDKAFKKSINFIGTIRTGIDIEITARISIASGLAIYKEELGTMDAQFISLCGHLNSAAPENSILITEDAYDNLSDELKENFGLCGTTKRDKVITFIYPKEKRTKKDAEKFLPDTKDPALGIQEYLKTIKGQCQTLLFSGIPQSSKIPLLELTQTFFPLKVKGKGRMIRVKIKERLRISDGNPKEETKPIPFTVEYAESQPLPFDEIFRKESHIILLGDPGSGKTTLLRWLALIYSQGLKMIIDNGLGDKRLIPFLLPISNLYLEKEREVNIHPAEVIQRYIKTLGVDIDLAHLKERLKKGECLILLDGLDEILEKKDRINTARFLEGFIRGFEKNRFVITSRIIGYEEIRVIGDEYILAELEDDEIGRFSWNWFLAFERSVQGKTRLAEIEAEKRKESIIEAIKESAAIRRLAKNPFLLTHICIIQTQGQTLPRYRVDLYRLMCETLFTTWVEARSKALGGVLLAASIDYREGEKVLAPLALWIHEEMQGGLVDGDAIRSKIVGIMKDRGIPADEAWKSTEKFFKYLANQTQLIVDKGGDRWGFRHRTFEEFLTAKGLIMNEDYDGYLERYSHNPQWEEVFLLLAGWIGLIDGREKEVTRIVERLANSLKDLENILHRDLLLAGKIVAENVGVKKSLSDRIINEIVSLTLNTDYSTLRMEATKVLKKGKELSVERLLEILGNKESKLRKAAARILGEIGEKSSVPTLTSILEDKGENRDVRVWAAFALGKIGEKASVPILTATFKDKGEDEWVRKFAAIALGKIGKADEEVSHILTEIISNQEKDLWIPALSSAIKLGLPIDDGLQKIIVEKLNNPFLNPDDKNYLFDSLWQITS